MKELFRRIEIEGKKGFLFSMGILISALFGVFLMFQFLLAYPSIHYSGGIKIGYAEFAGDDYGSIFNFGFGVFLLVLAVLLKMKIKVKEASFQMAIFLIICANGFEFILGSFGVAIPFIIYLVLVILCFCKFNAKYFKENAVLIALAIPITWIVISLFTLCVIGQAYNQINHVNHFRLMGKHPSFSSVMENCTQDDAFNWFQYNIMPVKESCYFERYMENNEILTQNKTSVLSVYYGGVIDLTNLFGKGHHRSIKGYSEREAVFLYQTAYEAMEKRYEMKISETMLELQKLFLDRDREHYEKSLQMSSKDFISYLRSLDEESIGVLSDEVLESLENTHSEIHFEENERITYDDLVRYKEVVYGSGKSTLFGDGDYQVNDSSFEYSNLLGISTLYEKKVLKMENQ